MTSIDPAPDPTELGETPPATAAAEVPTDVVVATPPARGSRFVRATAITALLGALLALAGIWVATRPVTTPVQDCGSAAAFLLDGRVDQLADPEDPPEGLTRAAVVDNNDRPCQERAAAQAGPGAVMIVAGTALGLLAGLVEALGRWWLRARAPVNVRPD